MRGVPESPHGGAPEPHRGILSALRRPRPVRVPLGAVDPARCWSLSSVPGNGHVYAPLLREALARDPQGTVARARELYLKCLGVAPHDQTGRVARMREIVLTLARAAERRRVEQVRAADETRLRALAELKHGPFRDILRNLGVRTHLLSEAPPDCPSAAEEDALNEGEWIEWADTWRKAWQDEATDHLFSVLPRIRGETYAEWVMRARATRNTWRPGYVRNLIQSQVDASVRQTPSARPLSRGSPSPATRRRRTALPGQIRSPPP